MRWKDKSNMTDTTVVGDDVLPITDVSTDQDRKITMAIIATWVATKFTTSIAGASQTIVAAINGIKTLAQSAATAAAAAQSGVTTNAQAIQQANGNIAANAQKIETNTNSIATLNQNLESVSDIVDAISPEVEDIRVGENGTTYPSAGDAVRGQIAGLKSITDEIGDEVFRTQQKTASSTAEGWRLIGDGLCAADNSYKLVKYAVVEGDLLYLQSDHYFQFQNAAAVPASGIPVSLIGEVYGPNVGYYTVPAGATYLIMSTTISDGLATCGLCTRSMRALLDCKTALRELPFATADNYKLKGDGLSVADSNYSIYKYRIGDARQIKIYSPVMYQFQGESSNIPASGTNSYLIGTPVSEPTYGTIDVPDGAAFLMISVQHSDTFSGIYGCIKSDNETDAVNPLMMTEKYIGHRGGGKTAPENTIPSMKEGADNGFRILELDIQFTSDNVPVILHDSTINRTARNADGSTISGTVNISNITYNQALEYDFGIWKGQEYAGTKIPSLDEALLYAKKRGCCVEIDLTSLSAMNATRWMAIEEIVENRGMRQSVYYTGAEATLNIISTRNNINVCIANVGSSETDISNASKQKEYSKYTLCSVQHPYATEQQVNYIHKNGMIAKGFTATTSGIVNSLFDMGVDKVILDGLYPSEVLPS